MKNLVNDINSKLKKIINDLLGEKEEVEASLSTVKGKIDEKIEEAKKYKLDVDSAKDKIKGLEEDISALEQDLSDLTERFGNKDLNSILEAGNKEINAKIIAKQNEITKYREKIGELTEKARAIKDLLINLKKDKELKMQKCDNYNKAVEYYQSKINEICTFAEENAEDLTSNNVTSYKSEIAENVDLNSPVFDEIDKMDQDEAYEIETEEETSKEEIKNEEPEESFTKMDFKALNESIDNEYANIFGDSEDINLDAFTDEKEEVKDEVKAPEEVEETKTSVNSLDIDGLSEDFLNSENATMGNKPFNQSNDSDYSSGLTQIDVFNNKYKDELLNPFEEATMNNTDDIVSFFNEQNVDFNRFSASDQEYLRKYYNREMFKKVFDVLNRNNISLDNIYDSASLFGESTPVEIEHVISKLLLAGQTTTNVGYVLSSLALINSFDLNEVIKSYGPAAKDANITDLIIKAKHLSDMGGNK